MDIEPSFMDQVWKVYERAGPKLKCRRRLRAAIENLDRFHIERNCIEVLYIRKDGQMDFAETEMRSARMVLRLLHFDSCINDGGAVTSDIPTSVSYDGLSGTPISEAYHGSGAQELTCLWGIDVLKSPTGPKLTPEQIKFCNEIVEAPNASVGKTSKHRLQTECESISDVYDVVRYFKWTKVACTWKYPETQPSQTTEVPENDFYGLRPSEYRSSSYVIRSLNNCFHSDMSFSNQRSTPSALLEAALSNIDVPQSITETLSNLEQLNNLGKDIALPNGEVFQKGKGVSGFTPVTPARRESDFKERKSQTRMATAGRFSATTTTTTTASATKSSASASVRSGVRTGTSNSSAISLASAEGTTRGGRGNKSHALDDFYAPRKSPLPPSPTKRLTSSQQLLEESRQNMKSEKDKKTRLHRSVQKHKNFAV